MAYPHKWSPISYKSSAGQRKHIGQRPMLYRWTTPPTTGSPTRTVSVDVILTLSKVKVKVTRLLNFRELAKPCMLAAMTAAPLQGFLAIQQLHLWSGLRYQVQMLHAN